MSLSDKLFIAAIARMLIYLICDACRLLLPNPSEVAISRIEKAADARVQIAVNKL